MKNSLNLIREKFESSSYQTSQYLDFYKVFKSEFTKLLKDLQCTEIKINKPNHFDISGFFKLQILKFGIFDLKI